MLGIIRFVLGLSRKIHPCHSAGLEHRDPGCLPGCSKSFDPEDTRFNNKDSVMSYNNFLYPEEDSFFTELDINALRQVWGIEKDN